MGPQNRVMVSETIFYSLQRFEGRIGDLILHNRKELRANSCSMCAIRSQFDQFVFYVYVTGTDRKLGDSDYEIIYDRPKSFSSASYRIKRTE